MTKTALNITHLEKKVGKAHLLHDISLSLETGDVFGFL
jgi:ABC-type multidrug transport system ATPase subunit